MEKKFYLYKGQFIDNIRELQKNNERDFELLIIETTPFKKYKKYFPATKHFYEYKVEKTLDKNGKTIYNHIHKNENSRELMVYNAKDKHFEQIKSVEIAGKIYNRKYKINDFKAFGLKNIVDGKSDPYQQIEITTVKGNTFVGYINCWGNKEAHNSNQSRYLVNVKYDEEKNIITLQVYYKKYIEYHYTLQMEKKIKTYIFNLNTHQSYEYPTMLTTTRRNKTKTETKQTIVEEYNNTIPFGENNDSNSKKDKLPLKNISRGQTSFHIKENMYPIVSYIEDIIINSVKKETGIHMSKKILFEENNVVNTSLIEYCNNGIEENNIAKDNDGNYDYGLQYLCKLNYNPLCPELVNYKGYFNNRFREYFKYEDPKQYNKFCEILNLPQTKKFKKAIRKNGHLMFLYLLGRSIGITDINAIYELFKIKDTYKQDINIYSHMGFIFRGMGKHGQIDFEKLIKPHPYEEKIKNLNSFLMTHFYFLPFMKDIIDIKTAQILKSNDPNKEKKLSMMQNTVVRRTLQIINNALNDNSNNNRYGRNIYSDVFPMYNKCRKDIPIETKLKMYNNGIDMWLHDVLSRLSRNLEYKNVDIKKAYTKNVKNLERKYGDYQFKLPKETMEIINIANEMDNCVASYINAVANKTTIIMGLYHKNKVVACIEIVNGEDLKKEEYYYQKRKAIDQSTKKFYIKQFKLYGNIPCYASNNIYEITNKWISEIETITDVCYDIKNNKEIYSSRDKKKIAQLIKNTNVEYEVESLSNLDTFKKEYDNDIISKKVLKDIFFGYYNVLKISQNGTSLGTIRYKYNERDKTAFNIKQFPTENQTKQLNLFTTKFFNPLYSIDKKEDEI